MWNEFITSTNPNETENMNFFDSMSLWVFSLCLFCHQTTILGLSPPFPGPDGNSIEPKGKAVNKQKIIKETKGKEETKIPLTPCTRICRYNSNFFGGQVCIGCYREAYEIGTWSSMTASEKHMTLLDAIDRIEEATSLSLELDGAISVEELKRQANYWQSIS